MGETVDLLLYIQVDERYVYLSHILCRVSIGVLLFLLFFCVEEFPHILISLPEY